MKNRSKIVIGVAITSLSIGAAAESVIIPRCENPLGYDVADERITVQYFECESDGVCGVNLKAPSVLDGREFLGFFLLFSDGRQGNVPLSYTEDEQGKNVYASFELPKPYFRTIAVHAIYDFKTRCMLHARWSPLYPLPLPSQ